MKTTWDVIVLGLGAMGSATAFELAARGQRVLGIDRFHPPHTRGSSHGRSRVIRQAYFEDPSYLPLLRHAYELWNRLEQDSGQSLIRRTGALMIGPEGDPIVEGSLATAREHGLAYELWEADELRRRFPPFQPEAGTRALFEEIAGVLKPEACIESYLALAARHGAELRFDEPVLDWRLGDGDSEAGDGVTVRTVAGTYRAERLVLTPGAWAGALLSPPVAPEDLALTLPLEPVRKVLVWMQPKGGGTPFESPFPLWIWSVGPGTLPGEDVFYGFPALDGPGGGVKIGFHSGGAACDPDRQDREIHDADIEALRRVVAHRMPALDGEVLRGCVCMYTNTPDGHFTLGLHPRAPNVTFAAGFSGHGFKFAGVVGEILADLLLEGSTAHPVGLFDPRRFASGGTT